MTAEVFNAVLFRFALCYLWNVGHRRQNAYR